jgi:hypothetical protein
MKRVVSREIGHLHRVLRIRKLRDAGGERVEKFQRDYGDLGRDKYVRKIDLISFASSMNRGRGLATVDDLETLNAGNGRPALRQRLKLHVLRCN